MYYFAYGSNMDQNRLEERIKRKNLKRQIAILKNYCLMFNKIGDDGYGRANIERNDEKVVGVLYELSKEELKTLDSIEKGYERTTLNVKLISVGEVDSEIYIASADKINNMLKPTKEYLNHLIKGADQHKLHDVDKNYVKMLEMTPTVD